MRLSTGIRNVYGKNQRHSALRAKYLCVLPLIFKTALIQYGIVVSTASIEIVVASAKLYSSSMPDMSVKPLEIIKYRWRYSDCHCIIKFVVGAFSDVCNAVGIMHGKLLHYLPQTASRQWYLSEGPSILFCRDSLEVAWRISCDEFGDIFTFNIDVDKITSKFAFTCFYPRPSSGYEKCVVGYDMCSWVKVCLGLRVSVPSRIVLVASNTCIVVCYVVMHHMLWHAIFLLWVHHWWCFVTLTCFNRFAVLVVDDVFKFF